LGSEGAKKSHDSSLSGRRCAYGASQGEELDFATWFPAVGNLGTFPIADGSSKILKITPFRQVTTFATGFTTVLGLAFDHEERLYVLENTTGTGNFYPTPDTGKILRIDHRGRVERNCVEPFPTHRNDVRSGWKPLCLQLGIRSKRGGARRAERRADTEDHSAIAPFPASVGAEVS
jgi:hypothetical protein